MKKPTVPQPFICCFILHYYN